VDAYPAPTLEVEHQADGRFQIRDKQRQFALVVDAEPKLDEPQKLHDTLIEGALVKAADFSLVVQLDNDVRQRAYDSRDRAEFQASFAKMMSWDGARPDDAKPITLAGQPATQIAIATKQPPELGILLVMPAHHRRYIFSCRGDTARCQQAVASGLSLH